MQSKMNNAHNTVGTFKNSSATYFYKLLLIYKVMLRFYYNLNLKEIERSENFTSVINKERGRKKVMPKRCQSFTPL